ncbi:MAG: CARDB domain-containing protein [Candidatus Eisenbacteria bacterium]|nr:CARDB domain-containing protein [Candidatus Eisenbacteria bacterium]
MVNASLDVQGTLLTQGATSVNGALSTSAGSIIRVLPVPGQSATLTVSTGFTNNGVLEIASPLGWPSSMVVTAGTLTNAPGGMIDALPAGSGTRTLTAALDNQGTLNVSTNLVVNKASAAHQNSGMINVIGGNLTLTQSGTSPSFTNVGMLTIGSGFSVLGSGVRLFLNDTTGVIQGSGTFATTGFIFTNSGAVNPGTSPGLLTVSGAFPQSASGELNMELGGLTAGTTYDRLAVSGAVTIDGTLNVSLINGFTPSLGDSFRVVTAGSVNGITTFNGLGVGPGLVLEPRNTGDGISLHVVTDSNAPETILVSGPADGSVTSSALATFEWTGTDLQTPVDSLTYSWSLDSAAFTTPSPDTTTMFTDLTGGAHTFRVRTHDTSGRIDASPAQRTWTVDLTGPVVLIDSGPAAGSAVDTVDVLFAWHATDNVFPPDSLVYSWQLDTGTASLFDTTQSVTLTGLSESGHTIVIRARDAAGNISSVSRSFTVDLTDPQTSIALGPTDGGATNTLSVFFSWSGTDAVGGLTFSTRLDGGTWSSFASATSGTFNFGVIGAHTFEVRARDSAGNIDATPAARAFNIEMGLPVVSILTGVVEGAVLDTNIVSFGWTGSDTETPRASLLFASTIDPQPFGPTTADSTRTFTGLGDGLQTFRVRSQDLAGNTSVPATRSFTVNNLPPSIIFTAGPANGSLSNDTTAVLAWSGSDIVSPDSTLQFQWRLDGGTYSVFDMTTTVPLSALLDGPHDFEVRCRDQVGKIGSLTRSWIVDLAPPLVNTPTARLQDGNTVQVTMTGSDDRSLAGFHLQVATDIGFTNVVQDVAVSTTGLFSFVGSNGAGYFARAYSIDGAGNLSPYSMPSNEVSLAFLPDLFVGSVLAPPTANSGQTLQLTWQVTNSGDGPTQAPQWYDDVYLSVGPTYSPSTSLFLGRFENTAYLAPGESYATTRQVTLPRGANGLHYLHVRTDNLDQQAEDSAANNTGGSAGFTIFLSDFADLRTTSVVVPPTAFSGEAINVQWTVRNQGSGRTDLDQWWDTVFLSPDSTLGLTFQTGTIRVFDQPLGRFRHFGALEADSSYIRTESITLPQGINGNYWLIVYTDIGVTASGQTVPEDGEVFENVGQFNNWNNDDISTTLTPPANLVVTAVAAPASINSGVPFNVSWSVLNSGLNPTWETWWSDRLYLSTNATLEEGTDTQLANVAHTQFLGRDSSYTSSAQVTLPNGTQGTYYFLVHADRSLSVQELDDGDNTRATLSAATVTVPPWPDLLVTDVTAPSSAVAGTPINVTWQVTNDGGAPSHGSWVDRVILSTSPSVASGTVLGAFLRPGTPGVGASYSLTGTLTLPSSLSGTYYVHVQTDYENRLFEHTDEGNNTGSSSGLIITPYPPVDLQASSVVGPATAFSGATAGFSWTTSNIGSAATLSTSWKEKVYLSLDPVLGGGDLLLSSQTYNGGLGAGASTNRSVNVVLGNGLTGTYHVIVDVDPDRSNSNDINLSNNVVASGATTMVQLTPPPDLIASMVVVPAMATAGQPMTVDWTTTNSGSGPAVPADWDVSVYLSTNQYLDGFDINLGTYAHTGVLPASGVISESFGVELPIYTSGPYYVIVDVDRNGEVYEAGAEVNRAHAVVNVILPPPADLVVTGISVPPTAEPGVPLTISWTIENQGMNPAVGQMRDGIYISADTTFTPDAPLVGITTRSIDLAPGAAISIHSTITLSAEALAGLVGQITRPLPGVSPGAYHAIVKTNLRNNIRETTLDNNENFSASPIVVDITPLQLEVPAAISLAAGQSRYFKLSVSGEFDLRLDLSSTEAGATNELYVAFDRAPTPGDFDVSGPPTFTAGPSILIPSIQDGTYYILIRAAALPSGVTSEVVTITARALPFSITSVSPTVIGSPGEVTLTVDGAGFRDFTRLYLSYGNILVPANRTVFINTTRMKGRFILPAGITGSMSVKAINEDETVTLQQAVLVEPARALAVVTTAVRQDFVRNNAAAYFTFRYRNVSNVDISHFQARLIVPGTTQIIAVQSSPGFLRRSDRYPELFAPTAGDHIGLLNVVVDDSIRTLDLETAHLAPEDEVVVTLNVTGFPTSPFSILSLTELSDTPTWLTREAVKIEASRAAILGNPSGVEPAVLNLAADPTNFRDEALLADHVVNGLLDTLDVLALADGPLLFPVSMDSEPPFSLGGGPVTQEGDCSHPTEAPDCTSEGTVECALPSCLACFDAVLPLTLRLGTGLTVGIPGTTCGAFSFEQCIDAVVVAPCDPNTLTGPPGFGPAHFVAVSQPMLFTANFENLSGVATAPAQVVQVNVPLHANLELSSFRLGSFGFGSHVIEVPPNRSSYTVEPYFSDLNLRVRVTAGVDINARKAFWTFTSIDPATGQLPTNPQTGFLPVNDQFGRGQGFCNFTVRPASGATTGAPISMQAAITFDTNAPVSTNTTSHTIDGIKPSSTVGAPQILGPNSVRVAWSASDDATGSGVGTFDLYLQQNNGGFQLVSGNLAQSAATLTLQPGHAYGFYTIARDNSGNPEPAKNVAEATINLSSGVGVPDAPPPPPQYALAQNYPNPFQSATTVQFDLPVETEVELQIFDVSGRLVASYLGGQRIPAGRHTLNLDAGSFGSGIYFYHLKAGDKLFTRKMLVVR